MSKKTTVKLMIIILALCAMGYIGFGADFHIQDQKELLGLANLKFVSPQTIERIIKGLFEIAILLIVVIYIRKLDLFIEYPKEIYQSRRLLYSLAKNDFKTKYAGVSFGVFWAFIQPVITVVLYWFVFEIGLKSGSQVSVPFVLWLMTGLLPWFFFSDSLVGGTNALIEYQYLVKKVVFQIDVLPVVKVLSALYVHVFFVLFTIVFYMFYGLFPTIYLIQCIYYTICTMVLVLAIAYATSAIACFFRDISQIIGILLQVGMWMTPIMWNYDVLDIPGWIKMILAFNPLYYIVLGYRDAFINHVWFWNRSFLTIYFWIVVVILMMIGQIIFKRLKVHFADVL